MIAGLRRYPLIIAGAMFIALLLPPVQHALTASMTAQMLVQIPLLIVVGWLLCSSFPQRLITTVNAWNHSGITGLLLAAFAAAFWMLPRSLDTAASEPLMMAAKFVSVPLLIGLPLGLSWPRMGFVVRGLFISELIAMFFRIGWVYLVSHIRLCSNYLLGDQQRTGEYMLMIGGAILLWVIVKLMWGHFDSLPDDRQTMPSHRHDVNEFHHPAGH
ncbi:MAG: hypothetical protein WBR15_08060 [Gammaproteobacteria bacterium]